MASPLIGAFKRSMPGSRISWLVEETSKAVLEGNQDLDEVIVWPRNRWRELLHQNRYATFVKEFYRFYKDLRERAFDLAIDAQGLFRSGLWVYLSGAPERVGIGSKEGSRFLMTQVIDRGSASDRISSQYLLLAEALGLGVGDFRMELALTEDAQKYGQRFSSTIDTDYVAFCPFTTRPQKHWLEESWRKLSDLFTQQMEMAVVMLGGPADSQAAERIMPLESSRLVNLTGKTSLQEAAAILDQAALVIGVDTGLTHMGFALGVPTIALFGATRPYLDTGGPQGTVIYHPHECSPCRRSPTCDGDFTCMKAITTDEVIETARGLLEVS